MYMYIGGEGGRLRQSHQMSQDRSKNDKLTQLMSKQGFMGRQPMPRELPLTMVNCVHIYLQTTKAHGKKAWPTVEEKCLLAHTQQNCHQWENGLKNKNKKQI